MMFFSPKYTEAATANSRIDYVTLDDELRALSLADYLKIIKKGSVFRAAFSSEPSAPTLAKVSGAVAAHTGDAPATPKKHRSPGPGDAGFITEIRVNELAKTAWVCVDDSHGREVWIKIT